MKIKISTYQLMPEMATDQYAALKDDIAERGLLVPLDVDEAGNILDGHNRYRAWLELQKNEPPPVIIRVGLSETEKRAFARKNNILRRHLTREQVRELIDAQLKVTPEWSNRRAAKELGVEHKTVGAARERLVSTGGIPFVRTAWPSDLVQRPPQTLQVTHERTPLFPPSLLPIPSRRVC